MNRKVLGVAIAWAWHCLAWSGVSLAQATIGADFETTFPLFGYAFDYSGFGDASCTVNTDSGDQVSSSYDVMTSPAAIGEFDTSTWNIPPDACYTYAGWGLGMGFFLPEDMRPTSGDLSQYTVRFDASASGYAELDDGLSADLTVILQVPDNNGDGDAEEYRIGVNNDNLGNLPGLPLLTETPQSFSVNLADLVLMNGGYDFAVDYAQTFIVLLQLAPATNAAEIGVDADNVITVDNILFEGPFGGLLAGDFDGNLVVDGNDFLIWQRNESPEGIASDDLEQWRTSFGQTGSAAASSAVPEPGSLGLVCAAALALLSLGRRRPGGA